MQSIKQANIRVKGVLNAHVFYNYLFRLKLTDIGLF